MIEFTTLQYGTVRVDEQMLEDDDLLSAFDFVLVQDPRYTVVLYGCTVNRRTTKTADT